MSIDTNLPLTLYKANLALWLRAMQLLQQDCRQWLERGSQTVNESIEETRAEVNKLLDSGDWRALAALPSHTAWRVLNQQVRDLQAVAQTAGANQTAFSTDWQQAFAAWQQKSAQALGQTRNAMPIHASLREFLQSWASLPAAQTAAAGPIAATAKPAKTSAKEVSHA